MRELKFKFVVKISKEGQWKEDYTKITQPYTLEELINIQDEDDIFEEFNDCTCPEAPPICECVPDYEIIEVLQCIDRKDENDKEIYEGHILEWNTLIFSTDPLKKGEICRAAVKFRQGYCWPDNPSNTKIIGNIHENPELLKEVK